MRPIDVYHRLKNKDSIDFDKINSNETEEKATVLRKKFE